MAEIDFIDLILTVFLESVPMTSEVLFMVPSLVLPESLLGETSRAGLSQPTPYKNKIKITRTHSDVNKGFTPFA